MSKENAGDIPRARTSLDLNSPEAMHFDKKENISLVINTDMEQRSNRWSQRCLQDMDVIGMNNNIYVHKCSRKWDRAGEACWWLESGSGTSSKTGSNYRKQQRS